MSELPEKPSIRARVTRRLDEEREGSPGGAEALSFRSERAPGGPEAPSIPPPSLIERTVEERRALLAHAVSAHVASGFRVESQVDNQAVLVRGRRPNHLLHLVLSIITLGLWVLFVWIPLAIFGGEKRRVVTVDPYGNVNSTKGHG